MNYERMWDRLKTALNAEMDTKATILKFCNKIGSIYGPDIIIGACDELDVVIEIMKRIEDLESTKD